MNPYTIVVAVANPKTVSRLMHTACLVAKQFAGRIMVTTVVPPSVGDSLSGDAPANRITAADQLLRQAIDYAKTWEVSCAGTVSLARQIHEGIVEVTAAQQADLIVIGFSERHEPSLQPHNFDRIIDAVAAHSPCHLLVAKYRDGKRFDRVLVPMASDLNIQATKDIITALHYQGSATIHFVHFVSREEEVDDRSQQLHRWLEATGMADWGTVTVQINPQPAPAIVEASHNYDAVIVGTPPLHTLRRQLFGSVAEYIANYAACTTYLVRSGDRP